MKTMNDPQDEDLRRQLRELGADVERRAPAFQRMWRIACETRTEREQQPGHGLLSRVFATAAVLVVAGVLAVMVSHHPIGPAVVRDPGPVAQAPVANPEAFDQDAPTDFLLADSGPPVAPSVDQLTREINTLLSP